MSETEDRSINDDQAQARPPHFMRIDGIAEHLGMSVRRVPRLVQERRIPFLEVAHFVMFDDAEIAGWSSFATTVARWPALSGSRRRAALMWR